MNHSYEGIADAAMSRSARTLDEVLNGPRRCTGFAGRALI
jgi:hypothetical protein